MPMDTRLRYVLVLAAAMLAIVALVLALKPEWWRSEQVRPEFRVFLAVEEPRETLMGSFRSYDSEDQVAQQIARGGQEPAVERIHVEGTSNYPPYKLDTLKAMEFVHRGQSGRLILDFFNDRLASVTFQPDDPKAYLRLLERTGVKFKREVLSRWAQEEGNLRISTNIIYATSKVGRTLDTPPYVRWEDRRLTAQSRQWYDDYGSKYAISPIRILGN